MPPLPSLWRICSRKEMKLYRDIEQVGPGADVMALRVDYNTAVVRSEDDQRKVALKELLMA